MRIALAQINSFLGDFQGNAKKIIEYIERAEDRHADLVVFPEAALFGYHPADLLELPAIVTSQEKMIREIHRSVPPGVGVLFGAFLRNTSGKGKGFWNAAIFLEKGKKPRIFPKQLLPTYDVFDESRHVEPGRIAENLMRFKGQNVLVTVCEDIWAWPARHSPWFSQYKKNPLEDVPRSKVDLVVNLSASPFTLSKFKDRRRVTRSTATHFGCPMVYVNMVGGQDELIFDGGSFAVDKKGHVFAQCLRFTEDLGILDSAKQDGVVNPIEENEAEILRSVLVLGLRDFARKTGFKRAHLGLSGGVDSALVACLAADAFGPMNVTAVYLPGPYSAKESGIWSRQLAENLGLRFVEIPITPAYNQIVKDFEGAMGHAEFGTVNENFQSRLRGLMLMGLSNREGSLMLGTSNKSELSVGYSTLYGDMIGGLMPIGDLLKEEVYEVARYYNLQYEVIPKGILERPPSAELRADQTDQDTLPPYAELDQAVRHLVENFRAPKSELEKRVLQMMFKSEFKRWQSPPILKVSGHSFGRGRRFPVAHGSRI
jgi:NAD+ synthase (glutamine-hydrolysing)